MSAKLQVDPGRQCECGHPEIVHDMGGTFSKGECCIDNCSCRSFKEKETRPASDVVATIAINRHCLHCAIWAVLEVYYPDKHINAEEVLNHLGDVLAEVLAMTPDHDKRKRALKTLVKWLPDRVIHHLNDRTAEHVH